LVVITAVSEAMENIDLSVPAGMLVAALVYAGLSRAPLGRTRRS